MRFRVQTRSRRSALKLSKSTKKAIKNADDSDEMLSYEEELDESTNASKFESWKPKSLPYINTTATTSINLRVQDTLDAPIAKNANASQIKSKPTDNEANSNPPQSKVPTLPSMTSITSILAGLNENSNENPKSSERKASKGIGLSSNASHTNEIDISAFDDNNSASGMASNQDVKMGVDLIAHSYKDFGSKLIGNPNFDNAETMLMVACKTRTVNDFLDDLLANKVECLLPMFTCYMEIILPILLCVEFFCSVQKILYFFLKKVYACYVYTH